MSMKHSLKIMLVVVLVVASSLVLYREYTSANIGQSNNNPWGDFPIVNYLFMTANQTFVEKTIQLQNKLNLTDNEMEKIKQLAYTEAEKLFNLKNESNEQLRLIEDQEEALKIGKDYNSELKKILDQTLLNIKELLGNKKYGEFVSFLATWWVETKNPNSNFNQSLNNELKSYLSENELAATNWIQVFATQYNGFTNDEVALPDKYIKFANLNYYDGGGWPTPPSYYNNPPYLLPIKYNSKQITKKILEVGPWNVNDNYWDPNTWSQQKPNIRRIYSILQDLYNLDVCNKSPGQLPQYKPEAQAAYEDGYFCGLDEFGRVTNRAGIDLTPDVASELGIGRNQNVWLYIDVGNLP